MALALPVLRIDRLAMVMPTFSVSCVRLILRLASMTSRLMMIGIGGFRWLIRFRIASG